jgi:hypothetical protein
VTSSSVKAYACGTPVRQHIIKAAADSVGAEFYPEAKPEYRGGDALVWGLIRGAPELIARVRAAGCNYYHMDNGYFGRNKYYRITKNANQVTDLGEGSQERYKAIAEKFGIKLRPWQKGGHIVLALSTEHLYRFFGLDINEYTQSVLKELRQHTDRKIVVRPKDANRPIENDLKNAWALVTHTSASALDALQWGVPVFTTGECSARPCALQDLSKIESPIYPDREPLFRSLASRMFTVEELGKGMWKECCGFS